MTLRELLHDIVDELHHLPASAKAEWHAKVDEATGEVADTPAPAEAPVVAPPAK
jgi:hypothetical protein